MWRAFKRTKATRHMWNKRTTRMVGNGEIRDNANLDISMANIFRRGVYFLRAYENFSVRRRIFVIPGPNVLFGVELWVLRIRMLKQWALCFRRKDDNKMLQKPTQSLSTKESFPRLRKGCRANPVRKQRNPKSWMPSIFDRREYLALCRSRIVCQNSLYQQKRRARTSTDHCGLLAMLMDSPRLMGSSYGILSIVDYFLKKGLRIETS